jgi:hypothetical protein
MRAVALCVGVGVFSGCGVFWSLDGLEGGQCTDGCVDGSIPVVGDDATSAGDASEDTSMPGPPDSAMGPMDSAGPGDGEGDAPACTPPTPGNLDDCKALIEKPSAPVIDGVLDCGVPLWAMPEAGWTGMSAIPAGVKAEIGAAWRTDGLYLFVRVTGAGAHRYPAPSGDGPWCGDAVELFVDAHGFYPHAPDYNIPGTMQFILVAPSDAMTSAQVAERFSDGNDEGAWTGDFYTVRTADGFDAEAFIQAADLGLASWTLTASARVGLDVAVDLGNPTQLPASCPLLGQFQIQRVPTDAACTKPACNVDEFCNPQLQ